MASPALLPSHRARLAGLLACLALAVLCVLASLAIGSRPLLGLVVGAALGAAGALMQGTTRNPLAEPGILGINAGAAFAVVVAIAYLHVRSVTAYVGFALAGAAAAAVLVFALG